MDRIERIAAMEGRMERAEAGLKALGAALEGYRRLAGDLAELEAYYAGPLWREDYAADEAGLVPAELRRGVLSEDGLWNLLEERDALRAEMAELGRPDPEP